MAIPITKLKNNWRFHGRQSTDFKSHLLHTLKISKQELVKDGIYRDERVVDTNYCDVCGIRRTFWQDEYLDRTVSHLISHHPMDGYHYYCSLHCKHIALDAPQEA